MEVKHGGKGIIVNLITKDVTVPASIKGNVNSVITILLPGENDISFGEGIRRKGEWVAAGSSWEKKDRYGLSGIQVNYGCARICQASTFACVRQHGDNATGNRSHDGYLLRS